MKRFYKNWPMHNIVAHPLMQILEWIGLVSMADKLHDATLPPNEGWENETDAKAAYDEHMAAAQALVDWEAAVGAGGMQALSAAPEAFLKGVIALCSHRGYSPANIEAWDKDEKWIADLWRQAEAMLAASPTPPAEQQAAPKVPPEYPAMPKNWGVVASVNGENILCIGDSYLYGKRELSDAEEQAIIGMARHLLAFVGYGLPPSSFNPDADEAPQQAAPKTAPGEHSDPVEAEYRKQLAQRGKVTTREWFYAGALWAQAAPQQEAQGPITDEVRELIAAMVSELRGHRWCGDCYPENGWPGVNRVLADYARFKRHKAPQPAPLSRQIDQLERKLAIIGVVGVVDGHDVVRRESVLEIARRAALAAQGGE